MFRELSTAELELATAGELSTAAGEPLDDNHNLNSDSSRRGRTLPVISESHLANKICPAVETYWSLDRPF